MKLSVNFFMLFEHFGGKYTCNRGDHSIPYAWFMLIFEIYIVYALAYQRNFTPSHGQRKTRNIWRESKRISYISKSFGLTLKLKMSEHAAFNQIHMPTAKYSQNVYNRIVYNNEVMKNMCERNFCGWCIGIRGSSFFSQGFSVPHFLAVFFRIQSLSIS